ncbi:aldose reductase, partial [Cystoisospora suis]
MPSIRELLFSATPTLWRKQHHHSQTAGRNSSLLSVEEDTPPEATTITGSLRTPSTPGKPHFSSSASSDLSRSSSKLRRAVPPQHSSTPSPPCSTRSSPCLQQRQEEEEEREGGQEIGGGHHGDSQGHIQEHYSVRNENTGRRSHLDHLHTSTSSISNTPRTMPSSAATSPSFDAELLKEHSSLSSPSQPDKKSHSSKKRNSSARNLFSSSSCTPSSYEEDDAPHDRKTSAIRVNGVPLSKSVEGEGHSSSHHSTSFCTSSSSPDLLTKDSTASDLSPSSSSFLHKPLDQKGLVTSSPSSSSLKLSKSTASLFSLFRSSKGGGGASSSASSPSGSSSSSKGQTSQGRSLSPALPENEGGHSSSSLSPFAPSTCLSGGRYRSSHPLSKHDMQNGTLPIHASGLSSSSSAILISPTPSPNAASVSSSASSRGKTVGAGEGDDDAIVNSSSSSSGKKSSCLHASATIAGGTSSSSPARGVKKLPKAQSHHGHSHSHTSPRSLPNPFFHRLHHSHHQGWMQEVSPRPPSKYPYPLCAPLRNGVLFPLLGLGTYRLHGDECMQTVKMAAALRQYMLIDTASVYRNEEEVGKALRDAAAQGLPWQLYLRDDTEVNIRCRKESSNLAVFITSKISPKDVAGGRQHAYESILMSMKRLGIEQIDLYLIHWPGVRGHKASSRQNRRLRHECWLALEQLYKEK